MSELNFKPIKEEHLILIHKWFNQPHVQLFYSLRKWTIEEVREKLIPYIQGVGDIKSYIIFMNRSPIGYIQSYPVKNHPWKGLDLSYDVLQNAAGLDLFIGEKNFLNKGYGCKIIDIFLKNYIWICYKYCLVDPDIRNEASIQLFKKCGFYEYKQIKCEDALQRPVILQLLLKKRD